MEGNKKYQIIYADPPWSFGNRMYSSRKENHHVPITKHFSVMKIKEICSLPIKELVDENSILFIWSTDAHLPDCLEVIKAWGFKYKTVAFYWSKKERSGKQVCFMGQWTMKNVEMCLLATKGKMSKFLKSRKVRQLVEAVRTKKHSQKPDEVRSRIVQLMGDLPRIELFAREKTPGWDVWGNEVESDIELKV